MQSRLPGLYHGQKEKKSFFKRIEIRVFVSGYEFCPTERGDRPNARNEREREENAAQYLRVHENDDDRACDEKNGFRVIQGRRGLESEFEYDVAGIADEKVDGNDIERDMRGHGENRRLNRLTRADVYTSVAAFAVDAPERLRRKKLREADVFRRTAFHTDAATVAFVISGEQVSHEVTADFEEHRTDDRGPDGVGFRYRE